MQTIWRLLKVLVNQSSLKIFLKYSVKGWFIWAPIVTAYLFWQTWLNYIHVKFINKLSWTLLEIKIPREIAKSPRAMELVLTALHGTKDGNFLERYWEGFLRMWYSLEIISVEGQIHFLIYTQSFFRNLIEAQIYAQYPGAEIIEVEDYTQFIVPEDLEKDWNLWGAEFSLAKEEAYPIRTYPEFIESGKAKEEEKIDPITSFLESLGSLREGEYVWFQILIRGAKEDWKDKAEKIIDELREQKTASTDDNFSRLMISPGRREIIESIEKNVAKIGFETGIRVIYLAKKDIFNSVRAVSLIGAMKQYSTQNLNGFKPARGTSVDYFFKKTRELKKKKTMLKAYKKRSYFYIPYRRNPFVLNTEALATIFHFPGRVAETPTLGRIEAKRGEPPINLPI